MIKDKFDNTIEIGDRVLYAECTYRGEFREFKLGSVVGETNCYVKIKPDKEVKRWKHWLNKKANKYEYERITVDYILREKLAGRFVSIKGLNK